jgi:sorbose reductase
MVSAADLFSLKNKNIIVTGGSRGIGRTVSNYLASAGANIAIISTTKEKSTRAAEEISKAYNVKTVGIGCDVSDETAVNKMVDTVSNTIGTADVLFNNAGINTWGSAIDFNYADWKRILDVNINGVFLVARAFAKKLISEQKPGSVINMASAAASIITQPQLQTAYHTSKAAVLHMTRSLAIEWVKYKIRVNVVSPGYVWSELISNVPQDIMNSWVNSIPFKRIAQPDEIAGAVIYFASDASSYTTGSELIIDGGSACL